MKKIICDRCGIDNEKRRVASVKLTGEKLEKFDGKLLLVEADLCGKCLDILIGIFSEEITNHRIGCHNIYLTKERFGGK